MCAVNCLLPTAYWNESRFALDSAGQVPYKPVPSSSVLLAPGKRTACWNLDNCQAPCSGPFQGRPLSCVLGLWRCW